MYTLAAIAVIILCKGIYDHYKLWRLGQPEDRERWCQVGPGLWRVVKGTLGHFRILRERYPGVMHWMFFWGFAIFALGTLSIAVRDHTGLPTFQGWYYLILSLMLNIFSLLVIIAVIMALWRRIVIKPDRIDNKTEDWISLAFVFFLVVTGLLLSGLRIAFTEDNWAFMETFRLFCFHMVFKHRFFALEGCPSSCLVGSCLYCHGICRLHALLQALSHYYRPGKSVSELRRPLLRL